MTTAIVFSGQGSQVVGMGFDFYKSFPQSREVFEEVDDTLHFSLSQLIFTGPAEILNKTQYAQPAIMAVSMAIWKVFHPQCQFMAGHSLGEYTALCAAQALTLEQTSSLLQQRGLAFAEIQGQMLVVLGLDREIIREVTQQTDTYIANENSALQTVISGTAENIEKADELLRQKGAKHTITLQVSGPFHSPLMEKSKQTMIPFLQQVDMKKAQIPVVSNVTAELMTEPEDIKQKLIDQMVCPVKWQESIQNLVNQGVDKFIEIGPGRVLTGLIKRIAPEAKTFFINSVYDLDNIS